MPKLLVTTVLAVAAISVATAVAATPRYSALQYSCGDIQSLIEQHGAAIFRYPSPRKPSLTLYDRYVSNRNYCAPYQITERVHIPSADTNRCLVRHCITADCDDLIGRCLYR